MKRIRIAGLCLVAVFALGAMIAAAGSASAAEYKVCVSQKKGEFTNSSCTAKSAKPKKGKFEVAPLATCVAQKKGEFTSNTCATKSAKPKKGKFEKAKGLGITSTTGAASLETPSLGGTVKCNSSVGHGAYTGPKTTTLQVEFSECETKGLPCSNVAGKANIKTNPLVTKLIGNPETGPKGGKPLPGEVWTQIQAAAGVTAFQAEFACEKTGFIRTNGTLSGVDGGANLNKIAASGTTDFELGIGEQGLETEASAEASFGTFVGPFASTQRALGTNVGEKEVEVKS